MATNENRDERREQRRYCGLSGQCSPLPPFGGQTPDLTREEAME
jgi:hypothetical protein